MSTSAGLLRFASSDLASQFNCSWPSKPGVERVFSSESRTNQKLAPRNGWQVNRHDILLRLAPLENKVKAAKAMDPTISQKTNKATAGNGQDNFPTIGQAFGSALT